MRDIFDAAGLGNERAKMAIEVLVRGIKKLIGAYAAEMGGLDCIVFTAGIGENNPAIRERVLDGFAFLGIDFDADANKKRGGTYAITTLESKVTVLVISTNEELTIARDCVEIVKALA